MGISRRQVVKLPLNAYSACRVVELRLRSAGFTTAWHYYVPKVSARACQLDLHYFTDEDISLSLAEKALHRGVVMRYSAGLNSMTNARISSPVLARL